MLIYIGLCRAKIKNQDSTAVIMIVLNLIYMYSDSFDNIAITSSYENFKVFTSSHKSLNNSPVTCQTAMRRYNDHPSPYHTAHITSHHS